MAEGNGIDLGSIYGLLVEVARTMSRQDSIAQLKSEVAAGTADLTAFKAETKAEFSTLQQPITQYHSSVVGHGILISDLRDRVRRIEHHLDLPSHACG